MLDISKMIPEKIIDIEVQKELKESSILVKGIYKNGRQFNIRLNRFVDERGLFWLIGLFAGEGSKSGLNPKKWRGMPWEIANSNPSIIKKTSKILEEIGITKNLFSPRLQIRLTTDELEGKVEDALEFWSQLLGIGIEKFRKPSVRIKKSSGKSKWGTISIRINIAILGKLFNFWLENFLQETPQVPAT